jgi:hypothetical protein
MMPLVRTVGKRLKSHLSLLKAGPSTAQSAFRSTGLRKENSDISTAKSKDPIDGFSSLTHFLLVFPV